MDTKGSQSSSEQHVQSMISSYKRERALSHAAKEHERKAHLETEEHAKGIDQPDNEAEKQPATPPRADTARADGTQGDTLPVQSVVRGLRECNKS